MDNIDNKPSTQYTIEEAGAVLSAFNANIAKYGRESIADFEKYIADFEPVQAPTVEPETQPDLYTIFTPINGYVSQENATARTNEAGTIQAGAYYVTDMVGDAINVSGDINKAGWWINVGDNVVTENADSDTQTESSIVSDTPEDDDSVIVPVRVVPPMPNKWQQTFKPFLGTVEMRTVNDTVVKDLTEEQPPIDVKAGTIIPAAGSFEKDGVLYLRTEQSIADHHWYGIPKTNLAPKTDEDDIDDDINAIYGDKEVDEIPLSKREKVIKAGATVEGKTRRLFSFGRNKKS